MKKELFAIIALCGLVFGSIANLIHLKKLTNEITTHLNYTNMYCHQEDYSSAKEELSKAMDVWRNAEDYTHIFVRQTEVDDLTDLFYDLRVSIVKKEGAEAMELIEKSVHKCQMLIDMERLSIESVF